MHALNHPRCCLLFQIFFSWLLRIQTVECFKIAALIGSIRFNAQNSLTLPKKTSKVSSSLHQKSFCSETQLRFQQADNDGFSAERFEEAFKKIPSNVYIIAPLVSLVSILVGVAYYIIRHQWNAHTSLYYTTQAIFGLMEDVPLQTEYPDKFFTLGLKVWGELLIFGAIGAFATSIVDSAITNSREKLTNPTAPVDIDGDGKIDFAEKVSFYIDNILFWTGWKDNKAKYLITSAAFFVWVAGILYGIFYEGFDLSRAIYFSLSQLSAAGTMAPVCEGDAFNCDMGVFRGVFNSLYLWIGQPLFSITVGQFGGFVIEKAVLEKERAKMREPVTDDEYELVASINGAAGCESKAKIDVAEFIVMQLLRLERLNTDEMKDIKTLFQSLDQDGSGQVDRQELIQKNFFVAPSPSPEDTTDVGDDTPSLRPIKRDAKVENETAKADIVSQEI